MVKIKSYLMTALGVLISLLIIFAIADLISRFTNVKLTQWIFHPVNSVWPPAPAATS